MKFIACCILVLANSVFATPPVADKESIRVTIRAHIQDVRECYETFLKESSVKAKGKIVLDWEIDPLGKVARAKVLKDRSDLNVSSVEDCVVAKVYTWKFPPAPKGSVSHVIFPFVLQPN